MEGSKAARRDLEVGLQDALELEQRFVVEADVFEVRGGDPGCPQAVRRRVGRKVSVALAPREPLLLGRGDDLAVPQQRRGAVVVKRRNTQNVAMPRSQVGRPCQGLPPCPQFAGDARLANLTPWRGCCWTVATG